MYYLAVPQYQGDALIPYQINLYAVGDKGTLESMSIHNTAPGKGESDGVWVGSESYGGDSA